MSGSEGVRPAGTAHLSMGIRRWQLVDMLRGIAVLLVLFRHHEAGGPLHEYGWMGVDLFFVLSGFLVSGLIFDEYRGTGTFDGVRFLIRRGFKIYPSFYSLILVSAIVMAMTGRGDPLLNYLAEIFFFQNYHEGLWAHTWSLAVEEHFYLLLVFAAVVLMAITIRFTWRMMIISCLSLFLLFLALRVYTHLSRPFDVYTHFYATHLRMDSLLGGVLLAAWHRYRPEGFRALFRRNRFLLLLCMVCLLAPTLSSRFGSLLMGTIGLTGVFLAGALAVGMAVTSVPSGDRDPIQRLVVRPLAWIGGISYTTYLWHLFVLLLVEMVSGKFGLKGTVLEFIVFVLASIVIGYLSSMAIERPFLRLRERWFPAKGRVAKEGVQPSASHPVERSVR